MKYIHIFCKNGEWFFEIVPGNKGKQPMGISKGYSTKKECEEATKYFKSYILNNHIKEYKEPFVSIEKKTNSNYYLLQYFNESGEAIYSLTHQQKVNSKKAISSIYRYVINHELDKIEYYGK